MGKAERPELTEPGRGKRQRREKWENKGRGKGKREEEREKVQGKQERERSRKGKGRRVGRIREAGGLQDLGDLFASASWSLMRVH